MIEIKTNVKLDIKQVALVFEDSGINRPFSDLERLKKMFQNSNLVISAWDEGELVGVCRSLTDFSYCCYLSDLAVKKSHQSKGIGWRLISETKKQCGPGSMLLLISAPSAMEYYPKKGFQKVDRGWILPRDV